MKRKHFIVITLLLLLLLTLIIYFYNDGILVYHIQKRITEPRDLINYYTGYNFSEDVQVLETNYMENSIGENIGDEALEAILSVPTEELEVLFPEDWRTYGNKILDISEIRREKYQMNEIVFSGSMHEGVRRWGAHTSRTMRYSVEESDGDRTKVYVFIDFLGWYQIGKWRLGGD